MTKVNKHAVRLTELFSPEQLEAMTRAEESRLATVAAVAEIDARRKAEKERHRKAMEPIENDLRTVQRRCVHAFQEASRLDHHGPGCSPSMGGCGCSYTVNVCKICGEEK